MGHQAIPGARIILFFFDIDILKSHNNKQIYNNILFKHLMQM